MIGGKKMEVYKISGYAKSDIKLRSGGMYEEPFEGHFVQLENDEIIGKITWERTNEYPSLTKGYSFIKGLFIDKKQLIFVEMTEVKKAKGFCFKDINEVGHFDHEEDWLCGLFSGETPFWDAYISVEQQNDAEELAQQLQKSFEEFCERLDDWKMFKFEHVQRLRDFIN